MFEVKIQIGANTSKYWATVQFEDKNGTVHERNVVKERRASENNNLLQALIDAIRILKRPCMVDVYTSSEYIIEPFKQGWIRSWEQHGWTNAKGKKVRNAEQWQQVRIVMAPHSLRFLYLDGRR